MLVSTGYPKLVVSIVYSGLELYELNLVSAWYVELVTEGELVVIAVTYKLGVTKYVEGAVSIETDVLIEYVMQEHAELKAISDLQLP